MGIIKINYTDRGTRKKNDIVCSHKVTTLWKLMTEFPRQTRVLHIMCYARSIFTRKYIRTIFPCSLPINSYCDNKRINIHLLNIIFHGL